MKVFLITLFLISNICLSFSFDLGGAFSLDYYNNPIVDSAPSPLQSSLVLFHSLDIAMFNLRSGFSFTEGFYEVSENNLPVFNDIYAGFYTIEFDLFAYPGISLQFTDSFTLSFSGGGGVRLPVLSKVDDGVDESNSFNWFYSDLHFIFWGAQLSAKIKLPMSESVMLFTSINYKDFVFRDDQWTIGATTGLLWHI